MDSPFISRAEWSAKPPRSTTPLLSKKGFAIHWEGPSLGISTQQQAITVWRNIQADHMAGRNSDHQPWNDIAYNFGISPDGSILEGRGWDNRSAANGSTDANAYWAAICYIGGVGDPLTTAAKQAFSELIQAGRNQHGFGGGIFPHSHFFSTQCPGDDLRSWIITGIQPIPVAKVRPMYDPPIVMEPWVADLACPEGGTWGLAASGAVYAVGGAPFHGSAHGQAYFNGRSAAQLEPGKDGHAYTIIATTGERYDY